MLAKTMKKFILYRCLALITITVATQIASSQVVSQATSQVVCLVEQSGEPFSLQVLPEPHSLGGQTKDISVFRVRTLMARSAEKVPWLLFEVYAESEENDKNNKPDYRILTSQKVPAPFATGRMEVVEPQLGRSLYYQCGASQ